MNGRRVAVTGIGVVAACGTGREDFWSGLLADAPVGPRSIDDFDPTRYLL